MTEIDKTAEAARETVASTEVVVPGKTLRELVVATESEIARALPLSMDPTRFVRIVQTELQKTPELLACTPRSFLGAVFTAAQLGLEFGPAGRVYMIPRKNKGVQEVQLVIGYKGWLDLVHRGGRIQSIEARAVKEGDTFDYEYGLNAKLVHKPSPIRGANTHFYCVAKTTNGGSNFEVMALEEVQQHMSRYAPRKDGNVVGPWASDFIPMALKTVFKRVYTWLPMSTEQSLAGSVDEHVVLRDRLEDEPDTQYIDAESEVAQ